MYVFTCALKLDLVQGRNLDLVKTESRGQGLKSPYDGQRSEATTLWISVAGNKGSFGLHLLLVCFPESAGWLLCEIQF